MKALLWKWKFARHAKRLLGIRFKLAWWIEGAWLEDTLGGDTSEDPYECVIEEVEAWRACC